MVLRSTAAPLGDGLIERSQRWHSRQAQASDIPSNFKCRARSWHSAADLMRCRALKLPGTLRSNEFAAIFMKMTRWMWFT
jgi:hypothetical protein